MMNLVSSEETNILRKTQTHLGPKISQHLYVFICQHKCRCQHLYGFGTSHRVNSILITRKDRNISNECGETNQEPTKKRKCLCSLPLNVASKEIPEYYDTKRIGPGELVYINNLNVSKKYEELSREQTKDLFIWIALRHLRTLPSILISGWTGFNILISHGKVCFLHQTISKK